MKTSASLRALLLFINALLWYTPVIHAATADSVNVRWDTRDAITSAMADSVNVTWDTRDAITSALSASGTNGYAFSYQITANNSPASYSASNLPAGLGVNTATGLISGTPSVTGTFSATIGATNGGGTGTAILVISVNPAPNSNADLTALQLGAGTLVPGFSAGETVYSLDVANSVASTTALAIRSDLHSSIQASINGHAYGALTSGKASGALALNVGVNLIEVKVIALGGMVENYAVTVYRLEPPVTNPATGEGTVTLNASVDGHGTSVAFQYGVTAAYEKGPTSAQAIVSGFGMQPASTLLTGLAPATLYHYRVAVTTGSVTDYGADRTFATAPAFPSSSVAAQGGLADGIPNARFASFGIPAINDSDDVAFQAVVSGSAGSGITKANNSGIWAGSNPSLIARTGVFAPGGGVFATLGDPVFNGHGQAAFLGTVSGVGSKNSIGIWANTSGALALVAQAQSQAPGCPVGAKFVSFAQLVLADQVVFLANLTGASGGVKPTNSQGIWAETNGQPKLILRTGDVLAGGTLSALSLFASPRAAVGVAGQTRSFNGSGDLSFKATFTNRAQGIFVLASGSAPIPVATSGSAAPSMFGAPAKFGVLGNPIINEGGNVAFQAFLSGTGKAAMNYPAILAETGSSNALGIVALTDSFAPDANGATGGIGTFATLSDPVFNSNDRIAFIGKLKTGGAVTGANSQGVWANTSGTLALVARSQGQAPGCPAGAKFLSFAQLVLPDQVVLLANLTGTPGGVKTTNNQGIWAADTGGTLRLVVRKGDALMINGAPKIIAALSLFTSSTVGTAGQTRSFNKAGDLVYKATFTDKTQAIQKVVFP